MKKRRLAFLALFLGFTAPTPARALDPYANGPFLLSNLQDGLNYLSTDPADPMSRTGMKEILFFVHGINEKGDSWNDVLRPLISNPDYGVFFFKWTKWQSPTRIQRAIGESLNQLLDSYSNRVGKFTVIAHSAGGVLLVNGLCFSPGSKNCVFRPELRRMASLAIHTLASPLGGFDYRMARLFSPFIGGVTSFIGGRLVYKHAVTDIELNIWETHPGNDPNARVTRKFDNRVPRFSGPAPKFVLHDLPTSSHTSAIPDALAQILPK
jgi:hypothetical protein